MPRLIDADTLKADIKEKRDYLDSSSVIGRGEYIALNKALTMIDEQPTVFQWYDPDEELPKKSGLYICLSPINNPYSKNWRVDLYRWNKGHFWWHDSEYGEGIVTGMYWWAEMPQMPEMEDEDATD